MSKDDLIKLLTGGTRVGKGTAIGYAIASINDDKTILQLNCLDANEAIEAVLEIKAQGESLASRSLPPCPMHGSSSWATRRRGVSLLYALLFLFNCRLRTMHDRPLTLPACLSCIISHQLTTPAPKRQCPDNLTRPPVPPRIPSSLDPNSRFSNRVHVILLGTEGYLYRPLDLILSSTLQIPLGPATRLLSHLHYHAIYYLNTLIRRRRALDFSPSDASLPPPRQHHDPP